MTMTVVLTKLRALFRRRRQSPEVIGTFTPTMTTFESTRTLSPAERKARRDEWHNLVVIDDSQLSPVERKALLRNPERVIREAFRGPTH